METLETRARHFKQHNKGNGSLDSVTFWDDQSKIQILTDFRFSRHELCIEYMRINAEEKFYRESKLDRPGYDASEYNPTQWRIICSYEEIVKRARDLHKVIEILAGTDPDLRQLVKPMPEFVITAQMWQEKMETSQEQSEASTEKTHAIFIRSVTCCKTLLPFDKYIRDGGRFDREIEALIFGFYRRDMEKYREDTKNDGF